MSTAGAPIAAEEKEAIRGRALAFGFDAVGFAVADGDVADGRHLATFVAEGRHGDMDWLARTADRRAAPRSLWPEARSIVVVGVNYGPRPPQDDPHRDGAARGIVSVYARGRDYHLVLKARLKALGRWLAETRGVAVKVFVDTAPVMEKPLAMRAGLGWIGKHTNLVSRRFGSWLFLGEVFTTLAIPPDPPHADHCGTCERCVRACPTAAIPEPYRLDPRRCISYLTIEHKGSVAEDLRSAVGTRIYGCDDCLAVCPWNAFARPTPHLDLEGPPAATRPRLAELAHLNEAEFRQRFSGSPIRRIGRDRLLRNVLIAAGNSGDQALIEAARSAAVDPSPPVRDAATWAVRRLGGADAGADGAERS
jgi:epoxyqueuosine reductase